MFHLDDFITELDLRLQTLKFEDILRNLEQIYEFKYKIDDIKALCKDEEIDHLAVGCYKGVAIKIVYDILKEKI